MELYGAPWRDLPDNFAPYTTCYNRFVCWRRAGVWDQLRVDVARFWDDRSVIVLRRGRDARSVSWIKLTGADTMTVAAKVAEIAQQYRPDAIFIDGGGPGGGVVDRLRQLQHSVFDVQFGGKADHSHIGQDGAIVYANKRAEMWGAMRAWLAGGMIYHSHIGQDGAIVYANKRAEMWGAMRAWWPVDHPDDRELLADLTGVEYGYPSVRFYPRSRHSRARGNLRTASHRAVDAAADVASSSAPAAAAVRCG